MLAGEPPFTGPNAQAIIARKMTETPRALNTVRKTVPPALSQLVDAMLAKSPPIGRRRRREFATTLEEITASGVTGTVAAAPRRRASSRRMYAIALAGVVIAGVLGAILWRQFRAPPAAAIAIAVLPFENEGPKDQDYFADGMTDEVRSRLSSVPGLQVTARTSTRQYKGTNKDPQQIARELSVRLLAHRNGSLEQGRRWATASA